MAHKTRAEDRCDELIELVEALRADVQTLRKSQQRLTQTVIKSNHEIGHRLASTRDTLHALAVASHTELLEHLEGIASTLDEQRQQIDNLERDVDLLFDGEQS